MCPNREGNTDIFFEIVVYMYKINWVYPITSNSNSAWWWLVKAFRLEFGYLFTDSGKRTDSSYHCSWALFAWSPQEIRLELISVRPVGPLGCPLLPHSIEIALYSHAFTKNHMILQFLNAWICSASPCWSSFWSSFPAPIFPEKTRIFFTRACTRPRFSGSHDWLFACGRPFGSAVTQSNG